MLTKIVYCSDHQSNTKKIFIKFHEKKLKGSQEVAEHKKTHENGQKYVKIAPWEKDRCENLFNMFATTKTIPESTM